MLTRQQMLEVIRSGGSIVLPDARHVTTEAALPSEEDLASLARKLSGHYTKGAQRALAAGNPDEAERLQAAARSYDLMAADRDAERVEDIDARIVELEARKRRALEAKERDLADRKDRDAVGKPQDAPGQAHAPEKAPEVVPVLEAATAKPGRFGRRPVGEE